MRMNRGERVDKESEEGRKRGERKDGREDRK